LTALSVTNTATDSDVPANTLTYSLLGAPAGAVISTNGVITWTPTEAQGPGSYTFTTRVTDNGTPPSSATNSFTVTVTEVNSAPVLTNLNNSSRSIPELTSITLTNRATDTDAPTNILTYEIVSGPAGASVNPTNGVFSWTPSEAQGPSSNNILVRVFDNGVPSLSATQAFVILVTEVNSAPILSPIGNKTVAASQLLSFTNVVNDADLPAQVLTFSLAADAPSGAAVDPLSGVFSWTPGSGQAPSTNLLSIQVADNGSPSLSATQTFTIFVVVAIRVTDIHTVDADHVSVTWETQNGKSYQLEYKDNLDAGTAWQTLPGSQVTATGSSQSTTITIGGNLRRFYRIAQTN